MSEPPVAANDWKRSGVTTSVLIRRGIFALVAVASLAALALAALPVVASTQLVRNRIAIELSAWSGFRVAIASTPQLEVWPTFKAVLSGVTFYQWGDWDNPAVIEVERVEIDLSAIEALNGNVSFSEAKLINPIVRLGPDAGQPDLDSITSSGRIAQAVEAVRTLVADNPDNPDKSRFPTTPFGSIDIQNGRVVTMNGAQEKDVITRLGGRIEWPALSDAGKISLTGNWRGEQVKLDASSDSPLALLAGAQSQFSATFASDPLKASIDGSIRTALEGHFKTRVMLDAPSVRRAAAWSGADITTGSALGSLLVSGDVEGSRNQLTVQNTQIKIDDDLGTGTLVIDSISTRPKATGKISFEHIDIPSLLSLFSPLMSYDIPQDHKTSAISDFIDMDMNIEAANAQIENSQMTGIVGVVKIDPQSTRFLLKQGKGFGGEISGDLGLDQQQGLQTTDISLTAKGIDGGQFAEAIGIPDLIPAATGDINLKLSGRGLALDSMTSMANGSIDARFGQGSLRGIDLGKLIAKTTGGGFFPLSEITDGVLAIDAAELEASIENGVGRIQKAIVTAGGRTILLSGIMPFAGRGVALSGSINSTDKISLFNPFGREATFFVGGSWEAPFVSAALPSQLPQ